MASVQSRDVSALALVPVVFLAAAAGGPPRAHVPDGLPLSRLLPLTADGEVALLPEHDLQPFNAVLVTRSSESCETVARSMLDVENYPSRFNVKRAHILEKSERAVRYELELGIIFAPRVPGHVSRTVRDKVIYDDLETGAQFIWTLQDLPRGCAMTYSMLEANGKASGWVGVVRALEASAVDAANFAAGLSSARGFTRPEDGRVLAATVEEDRALGELARHGTALRVLRAQGRFPVVVTRRVIDRPAEEVRAALLDRSHYGDRVAVVRGVQDRGKSARWDVGAFGGRVRFDTASDSSWDADQGLFSLTERVTGGDIPAASGWWTWRVQRVPEGTDVQLTWSLDLTAGSAILDTMARTDPIARESLALHMALSLMGRVVGGTPVGAPALAHLP